jgi:hypothetical protein
MGTRADFYVGVGPEAEWLGSIAWDGYAGAENPNCGLMRAKTEEEFRKEVDGIRASRDDFTAPEDGWP